MREILFRGKMENGEGWVFGHYHNTTYVGYPNGGDNKTTRHYILPPNSGDAYVVIPETVGQFTGLEDKTRRKIFEGDIVRYMNKETMVVSWRNESASFVGTYSAVNFNYCVTLMCANTYLEIIGNIYDNPELLEVKNAQHKRKAD